MSGGARNEGNISQWNLLVTDEQRSAIEQLFQIFGWDIVEATEVISEESETPCTYNDVVVSSSIEDNECSYCLTKPCITHERFRQLWWLHDSKPPHSTNSRSRKDIYRRFWTMLDHRGVWGSQQYIERKAQALAAQSPELAWSGPKGNGHPRDLMPECVVKLVRGWLWLPNPPGQPYMGHKWN